MPPVRKLDFYRRMAKVRLAWLGQMAITPQVFAAQFRLDDLQRMRAKTLQENIMRGVHQGAYSSGFVLHRLRALDTLYRVAENRE